MVPSQIRPFQSEDIPAVAEIHREVFSLAKSMSPTMLDRYRTYFEEVFLKPAAECQDLGSLVCEEDGQIVGFIGSAPRRMTMNGRPVMGRVSTQFVVHPRSRGIAGMKLLKTFLAGRQDFSIADESNSMARALWMSMGAATCALPSIIWNYPLRPVSFGLYALARFRPGLRFTRFVAFAARALDGVIKRSRGNGSHPRPLDREALGACLSRMVDRPLRPCYDSQSLACVLKRAARLRTRSALQTAAVESDKGLTLGWYVFSISPEGICQVLQFHARKGSVECVFEQLLGHAAQTGAVAVTGRLDHGLMEAASAFRCLMHAGPWVLVHSRNPELVSAFERGDAFFSRLEGEWCLRFQ